MISLHRLVELIPRTPVKHVGVPGCTIKMIGCGEVLHAKTKTDSNQSRDHGAVENMSEGFHSGFSFLLILISVGNIVLFLGKGNK